MGQEAFKWSRGSQKSEQSEQSEQSTDENVPSTSSSTGNTDTATSPADQHVHPSDTKAKFTVTVVADSDVQKNVSNSSLDIATTVTTFDCGDAQAPKTESSLPPPESKRTLPPMRPIPPNKQIHTATELLKPGPGLLSRAQLTTRSVIGAPVNFEVRTTLQTKAEQLAALNDTTTSTDQLSMATLSEEPFNEMSMITENLVLTSAGGLYLENFNEVQKTLPVKCLFNTTTNVPLLKLDTMESYRIPVSDDELEDLSFYFDEVTGKMEEIRLEGTLAIIHGWAGVARSATFVLAYLIRYNSMSLEDAYRHLKLRRLIMRPTVAHLEMLTEYEVQLRGEDSRTKWTYHRLGSVTKKMPDFIMQNYKEFYLSEFGDHHFTAQFDNEEDDDEAALETEV